MELGEYIDFGSMQKPLYYPAVDTGPINAGPDALPSFNGDAAAYLLDLSEQLQLSVA
jgi:hypothetical protein